MGVITACYAAFIYPVYLYRGRLAVMTRGTEFTYREFLTGTKYCDTENAEIQRRTAHLLSPSGKPRDGGDVHSAVRIFDWVRDEVKYSFDFWNVKASETMRKMSGMCANKANLQIAMLRAAGIPAGYGLLRIRKEAIRTIANDEIYSKSSDVIIHVYCRVLLNGQWISADATVDRELYEAAYLKVPDWEYLSWDGQSHFRIPSSYIVEDMGLRSNIDEYMDMPPRFLTDDIIKRANDHVNRLRRK
jgi:transglutaminase-like putative cysteine protease